MQYKCQICHDTGNKDRDIGGSYLNCIACSAATDRVALEAFIEKLPAMGEQNQAWAIHQRALAMAPKQEADHINDVVKMVAPPGWKLVPVEPTDAMAVAAIKVTLGNPSVNGVDQYRAMLAEAPAAPAAANGAMTDESEAFEAWAKDHLGQGYSLEIEEHTYANPVTRWAFVAFKAGRAALSGAKGKKP